MQRVSSAYKAEQNEYLRNESYVWVFLGIVSKEAQVSAKAQGTFAPYSYEEDSTKSVKFEAYYATPEENFTRVDGSQYFLPRSGGFALYQGAVTQDILAPITYSFAPYTALNIKGLTINFGDAYPTKFTVSNGLSNYTYENDSPGEWVCEDVFSSSSYITITPITMVGGRQRLRILNITFGVGLSFDNTTLLSTSWKSTCSHVSGELPTKTFSFSVSNLDKRFAADDPQSFVSFLQEQQAVEFQYGRRLSDDSLYIIPGGKLMLKSWSSDDNIAKFGCVGFLDYQSGTYKKGKYYQNGRSLYDLMVDVLQDAGIEEYTIDNYLKSLYTHNPLPIEKHKNLIQLIANSGRCIFREDRVGKLEVISSFEPEVTGVTSNGAQNYCKLINLCKTDVAANEYASAELNYSHVDGTHYFRPRNNAQGVIEASYTSSEVSKADGTFTTNPTLTIQWESAWTFFDMSIRFKDAEPKRFKVYTYNYGTLVDTIDQTDIDSYTIVRHDFYNIDKVVIEFIKTAPYQRIHVGKIAFGDVTDFTINYKDMSQSPKAVTSDFIRDVNVNYYEYAYGGEDKKLGSTDAVIGANTVTFAKPCHGYSLAYADGGSGTLNITFSGAYCIEFTSTRAAEVEINGREFAVTERTVTSHVNDVGTDKTAKNVLLDNKTMATAECAWLAAYFANDIDYQIQYRGEPALDPDDQIYTENKYVEKNLVRIVDTQIDTSTGMSMSCKLNARRISYMTPALVDVAKVDLSEVPE